MRYLVAGGNADEQDGVAFNVSVPDKRRAVLVTDLLPDEPVFVLRARDAVALGAIADYGSKYAPLFDVSRQAQLEQDLAEWVEWRRSHRDLLRDPD